MSDARTRFFSLTQDLWSAFRWLTDLDDAASAAALADQRGIRTAVHTYAAAYDDKDLARILDHFAVDAVLVNRRLNSVHRGREQIRAVYEPFTRLARASLHRVENMAVRVTATGAEGWVAAYFHAPLFDAGDDLRAQNGRYFGRLTRHEDARWRFADWCISVDHTRVHPR